MLRVELFTQQKLAEIMMGVCFSDNCDKCPEFTQEQCDCRTSCAFNLVDTLTDEAHPQDMIDLMSDDCAELLEDINEGSRAWDCAELTFITTRIHHEIADAVDRYDLPVRPSQIAYMIYSNMLDEESSK